MNRRSRLLAVAAAISMVPVTRAQAPSYNPDVITNWPAPLYWQPPVHNSDGSIHRGRIQVSSVKMDAAPGAGLPATFVAMSPCRVIDTRNSTPAGFAGPAFGAGETRHYQITSGPCPGIPANAVAYSFNIGVIPQPYPGGTLGWLTAWDTGSLQPVAATLNDSAGTIVSNAAIVPAGTPNGSIDIFAHDPTQVIVDINGYYLASADALQNTQLGVGALPADTTGFNNTAFGSNALSSNSSGTTNTAVGSSTLLHNTNGQGNTAVGVGALSANTTGGQNTAIGVNALSLNTSGSSNTAIGPEALGSSTGDNNFAIGYRAGLLATTGNFNVFIASEGAGTDSNLIRIGDPTNQTRIFVAAIRSVTTGAGDAIPVLIDSNGQLGTASSSRVTKQDIEDMGDTTNTLMSLHPVRFHYKAYGSDSPMQYGLIAEDVAEVAPDLVAHTQDGKIETVFYDKVNAMVLNQVQVQQRLIEKQSALIQQLESRIAELENRDK